MKSMFFWYEGAAENTKLELHFNLWHLGSKTNFLDVGMKLSSLSGLQNIKVFAPHLLPADAITDLGKVISEGSLLKSIFNDDVHAVSNGGTPFFNEVRRREVTGD